MNMVNYLYNDLKQEIEQMPEIDDSTMTKIRDLRNEFETDSFLIPDSNSQYAIDDLANKYFHLQTRVRDCQAKCLTTSKSK